MKNFTYKKELKINEIFYSIQGEGYHTGKPAVFIRFSNCNLRCDFCDTEFKSGKIMTVTEIISKVKKYSTDIMIILTGGEPTLYNLYTLTYELRELGFYTTIETNGIRPIKGNFDWVTVSPKKGWFDEIYTVRMNEVKYIVENGTELPNTDWIDYCEHYWISPMNWSAMTTINSIGKKSCNKINKDNIKYCVDMVKSFPKWKLNIQMHKYIGVE